jgi:hypothetical protein
MQLVRTSDEAQDAPLAHMASRLLRKVRQAWATLQTLNSNAEQRSEQRRENPCGMKTKLVPHRQRARRCPQAIGSAVRAAEAYLAKCPKLMSRSDAASARENSTP